MRRAISTTTQTASIVVIQGACQNLFTPAAEVVFDVQDFFKVVGPELATSASTHEDWLRFQGLVDAWRQERGAMSSITEAAMTPAYQAIIGIGDAAVPFIMRTVESEGDEPDQWFWALKAITGTDPVDATDRGNYRAMADAWLSWGRHVGYVW